MTREIAPISGATPVPLEAFPEVARAAAGWLLGYSSDNTRRAYGADLRAFVAWLAEVGVEPFAARRTHVDAWARTLEAGGARPSTVARRIAAVSSFYEWCADEGLIDANPARRVRRPRPPADSPTVSLDREELIRLIAASEASGARDHLLVLLLAVNGLRVSEACALDVENVAGANGHRVIRIAGKGGTEHRAPLPPQTLDVLDAYLDDRTSGALLLDNSGNRLDRHDATRIVRRLARRAGLSERLSPHGLRHSAVTAALDADVPLRDVQDFARHADPRTTRRYDQGRQSLDRHASYAIAQWLARAPARPRKSRRTG
jgi:integrase/recombinase XerD